MYTSAGAGAVLIASFLVPLLTGTIDFRFLRSGSSRGKARILFLGVARVALRHAQSNESRKWRVPGLASESLPRLRRVVWIADATALLHVFLLLRPVKRLPIR